MASKKQLTGGSGDVNPQWMSFARLTLSGANVTTSASATLPVPKIPASNKSTIIEVLKIVVHQAQFPALGAPFTGQERELVFSTISFGTVRAAWFEPNVFAIFNDQFTGAFTAAGTFGAQTQDVWTMDLTDGAGHGLLLATDRLFIQGTTVGYGVSVANFDFKILYRFKTVGLLEYIGIVQSQQ